MLDPSNGLVPCERTGKEQHITKEGEIGVMQRDGKRKARRVSVGNEEGNCTVARSLERVLAQVWLWVHGGPWAKPERGLQ